MLLASFSFLNYRLQTKQRPKPQSRGSRSGRCIRHRSRSCSAVALTLHLLLLPPIPWTWLRLFLLLVIGILTFFSTGSLCLCPRCWHFLRRLYLRPVGTFPVSADALFCHVLYQSVLNTGASWSLAWLTGGPSGSCTLWTSCCSFCSWLELPSLKIPSQSPQARVYTCWFVWQHFAQIQTSALLALDSFSACTISLGLGRTGDRTGALCSSWTVWHGKEKLWNGFRTRKIQFQLCWWFQAMDFPLWALVFSCRNRRSG